jgi:hypothetical protein
MSACTDLHVEGHIVDITNQNVRQQFAQNRIAKTHQVSPEYVLAKVHPWDFQIIGIVRNPRDRIVSWAFHCRYQTEYIREYNVDAAIRFAVNSSMLRQADSDKAAVKLAVALSENDTKAQFELMRAGESTKGRNHTNYIWTTYEWLLHDPVKEVSAIVAFLAVDISQEQIAEVCRRHSFHLLYKRRPGTEQRDNAWGRKGIVGDWKNWFDSDMLEKTQQSTDMYDAIIAKETA